jgi:hypothetical protein
MSKLLALLVSLVYCAAQDDNCAYPRNCPGKVFPRADKQTWQMNLSTIIMPCNDTGFTDPQSTLGWGIVDFDWSNAKGTGAAEGWAKHQPMDDEEMLFKQVQMTAAATPGTTVWVYRCSVYAYPWYTSVRTILDDPAYEPWFLKFKPQGPWSVFVVTSPQRSIQILTFIFRTWMPTTRYSPKCDNNYDPPRCSDYYHMQEQTPGYPHGDGDCAAPGCDCGTKPCGFYMWNHSSTAVVKGQTFQEWFINDYILNKVGMSPLVSGFFWDDYWPAPGSFFPDSRPNVSEDLGLSTAHWAQITDAYHSNMDVLRNATLTAGKFAWQLMWTGGADTGVGGTVPRPIVSQKDCASQLRTLCSADSPSQTRAMMYALGTEKVIGPPKPTQLHQDLANFLLIRGPYAWLGHGWEGCSRVIPLSHTLPLSHSLSLTPSLPLTLRTTLSRTNSPLTTERRWASALKPLRIAGCSRASGRTSMSPWTATTGHRQCPGRSRHHHHHRLRPPHRRRQNRPLHCRRQNPPHPSQFRTPKYRAPC